MKNIIFLVSSVVLLGCSQFGEPQKLESKPVATAEEKTVQLEATFTSIKTQILDVKCLRCHSANSSSRAKEIPFDTEEQVLTGVTKKGSLINISQPSKSILYLATVLDENIRGDISLMPPRTNDVSKRVSPDEQQVILAWISGVASGTASNP